MKKIISKSTPITPRIPAIEPRLRFAHLLLEIQSNIESNRWVQAGVNLRDAKDIIQIVPNILDNPGFHVIFLLSAYRDIHKEKWSDFESGINEAKTVPNLNPSILKALLKLETRAHLGQKQWTKAMMAIREIETLQDYFGEKISPIEIESLKFSVFMGKGNYEKALKTIQDTLTQNPTLSVVAPLASLLFQLKESNLPLSQKILALIKTRAKQGDTLSEPLQKQIESMRILIEGRLAGKEDLDIYFDTLSGEDHLQARLAHLFQQIQNNELAHVVTYSEKLLPFLLDAPDHDQSHYIRMVATYFLNNNYLESAGNWFTEVLKQSFKDTATLDLVECRTTYLEKTYAEEAQIKSWLSDKANLIARPRVWLRWAELQTSESALQELDRCHDTISSWPPEFQDCTKRLRSVCTANRLKTLEDNPEAQAVLLRKHDEQVPAHLTHPNIDIFRIISGQKETIRTATQWTDFLSRLDTPTRNILNQARQYPIDTKDSQSQAFWRYVLLLQFIQKTTFSFDDWSLFETITGCRYGAFHDTDNLKQILEQSLFFIQTHHDYFAYAIESKQADLKVAKRQDQIVTLFETLPTTHADLNRIATALDIVINIEDSSRALYAQFSGPEPDEDTPIIRLTMHPGSPIVYTSTQSKETSPTILSALALALPKKTMALKEVVLSQLTDALDHKGSTLWQNGIITWLENQALHPNIARTLGQSSTLWGTEFETVMTRLFPAFERFAFRGEQPSYFEKETPIFATPLTLSGAGFYPFRERSEGVIAEIYRENWALIKGGTYSLLWFFAGPVVALESVAWDIGMYLAKTTAGMIGGKKAKRITREASDWMFTITGFIRSPELSILKTVASTAVSYSGLHERDQADVRLLTSFTFNHLLYPLADTFDVLPSQKLGVRELPGFKEANQALDLVRRETHRLVGKGVSQLPYGDDVSTRAFELEYAVRSRISYGLGLTSHPNLGIPEAKQLRTIEKEAKLEKFDFHRFLSTHPLRSHLDLDMYTLRCLKGLHITKVINSLGVEDEEKAFLREDYIIRESIMPIQKTVLTEQLGLFIASFKEIEIKGFDTLDVAKEYDRYLAENGIDEDQVNQNPEKVAEGFRAQLLDKCQDLYTHHLIQTSQDDFGDYLDISAIKTLQTELQHDLRNGNKTFEQCITEFNTILSDARFRAGLAKDQDTYSHLEGLSELQDQVLIELDKTGDIEAAAQTYNTAFKAIEFTHNLTTPIEALNIKDPAILSEIETLQTYYLEQYTADPTASKSLYRAYQINVLNLIPSGLQQTLSDHYLKQWERYQGSSSRLDRDTNKYMYRYYTSAEGAAAIESLRLEAVEQEDPFLYFLNGLDALQESRWTISYEKARRHHRHLKQKWRYISFVTAPIAGAFGAWAQGVSMWAGAGYGLTAAVGNALAGNEPSIGVNLSTTWGGADPVTQIGIQVQFRDAAGELSTIAGPLFIYDHNTQRGTLSPVIEPFLSLFYTPKVSQDDTFIERINEMVFPSPDVIIQSTAVSETPSNTAHIGAGYAMDDTFQMIPASMSLLEEPLIPMQSSSDSFSAATAVASETSGLDSGKAKNRTQPEIDFLMASQAAYGLGFDGAHDLLATLQDIQNPAPEKEGLLSQYKAKDPLDTMYELDHGFRSFDSGQEWESRLYDGLKGASGTHQTYWRMNGTPWHYLVDYCHRKGYTTHNVGLGNTDGLVVGNIQFGFAAHYFGDPTQDAGYTAYMDVVYGITPVETEITYRDIDVDFTVFPLQGRAQAALTFNNSLTPDGHFYVALNSGLSANGRHSKLLVPSVDIDFAVTWLAFDASAPAGKKFIWRPTPHFSIDPGSLYLPSVLNTLFLADNGRLDFSSVLQLATDARMIYSNPILTPFIVADKMISGWGTILEKDSAALNASLNAPAPLTPNEHVLANAAAYRLGFDGLEDARNTME